MMRLIHAPPMAQAMSIWQDGLGLLISLLQGGDRWEMQVLRMHIWSSSQAQEVVFGLRIMEVVVQIMANPAQQMWLAMSIWLG